MKGRIEFLTWRAHGADEASSSVAVFRSHDRADAKKRAVVEGRKYGVRYAFGLEPYEAEPKGQCAAYTDLHETIHDGQVLTSHDGRKFQVSIAEVPVKRDNRLALIAEFIETELENREQAGSTKNNKKLRAYVNDARAALKAVNALLAEVTNGR